MLKGDLHRFGKQVSFHPNDLVVLKPRPTHIEHLFLDQRSPIKDSHASLGIYGDTRINSISDWEGECENLTPYIISDKEIENNLDFFFATAGKLIATATVFGFNDLHCENILFIKKDNQLAIAPVDLEIIYYKFITSAECCLYPSIKVAEDSCGLKRLIPYIQTEFLTTLIDHTIEAWDHAIKTSPKVRESLNDIPVRMIFRQSKSYAQYLANKDLSVFNSDPIKLTSEEIFQMNQGDIPYFFSKYNEPLKMLYFNSSESMTEAHEVISHPSTARHLSAKVDENDLTLFYTSIAHQLVNLIKIKKLNFQKITGKHFEAEMINNQLIISIGNQVIKVLV